jgi:hypothetical protein
MMRNAIVWTLLALPLGACDRATPPQQSQQQEDYAESSGSFDVDEVQPFLDKLGRSLDAGFGPAEIEQVMSLLRQQAVGDEAELEFSVTYKGERVPLNLTLFMDDVNAPELYFFTSPALAARLDELMDERAAEQQQQQQQES